ncbi:MAG: hypothetical protein R6X25_06895 [Candidatus Krumholzibacteriia bacterium]
MKRLDPRRAVLLALAALVLGAGCGDDSDPTEPDAPTNLPPIPEPTSVQQLMPERSPDLLIGMSGPLDDFVPAVTSLEMMQDNGTLATYAAYDRHLRLACPGYLPVNTAEDGAADATFLTARPHLLHTRHWKRLEQDQLGPGTSLSLTTTYTYGASTTDAYNRSFSETIGVTTQAGGSWQGLSASLELSYSQTETYGEVHSMEFWNENSEERTYTVIAPASGTRVYVLWQLVDVFSVVDSDTIAIHESPTLMNCTIPAVPDIEFPNKDVMVLKTTDFAN